MNAAMIAPYAVLLVCAAVLAAILTPIARRLAPKAGLIDRPGERKIHDEPIPCSGGIAIVASILVLLVGGYLVAGGLLPLPLPEWLAKMAAAHREGLLSAGVGWRLAATLGGMAAIFVLGLVDDRRGIGPLPKLAVEILAGIGVYLAGIRITLFVDVGVVTLLLTVGWVVLITNTFNLLDNMDGLSAGVAAIAAAIFLVVAVQGSQVFVAGLAAVVCGAALGFLPYNLHPARVFMGDAGALPVGFLLAVISIAGTYYGGGGDALAVVTPLVVLAIPLFDTLSVLAIRWRAGRPLMQGDRNHFSHRLVRLGMTRREAVGTIYILTAALGATATLMPRLDAAGSVVVLLHTIAVLAVVALLERAAARGAG
jgi:UDP-GlcNAc:undecaprenyl-phosphate GlcNAc-1-phosphate transferase